MRARLIKQFPELFIKGSDVLNIDDGWLPIIEKLCDTLNPIILAAPEVCICGYTVTMHPVAVTINMFGNALLGQQPIEQVTRELCNEYKGCRPHFEQVKQKFGELDVYVSGLSLMATRDAINAACDEARVTCEVCSGPGSKTNISGWLSVLCEPCTTFRRTELTGWRIRIADKDVTTC